MFGCCVLVVSIIVLFLEGARRVRAVFQSPTRLAKAALPVLANWHRKMAGPSAIVLLSILFSGACLLLLHGWPEHSSPVATEESLETLFSDTFCSAKPAASLAIKDQAALTN